MLGGGLRTSLHIPIRIKFPESLSDTSKIRGETTMQNEQGKGVIILGSLSPKMPIELIPAVAIAAQSGILAGPSRYSRHILTLNHARFAVSRTSQMQSIGRQCPGSLPGSPCASGQLLLHYALCVPGRDQYVLRAFAWLYRQVRNGMDCQGVVLRVLGATVAGY